MSDEKTFEEKTTEVKIKQGYLGIVFASSALLTGLLVQAVASHLNIEILNSMSLALAGYLALPTVVGFLAVYIARK